MKLLGQKKPLHRKEFGALQDDVAQDFLVLYGLLLVRFLFDLLHKAIPSRSIR